MGVASGAHLVVIAEEFAGDELSLERIADRVEAAILKRRAAGLDWGLAVLAEGLLDRMDTAEIERYVTLQRDEHGHPRVSEIDLGGLVRDVLVSRFASGGPSLTFVTKIIGYELRCADPVAFDVQYTRTLGFGAVEFLASGSGNALISLQAGRLVPIPFEDLRDPATGKVRVRRVDVDGRRLAGRPRPADPPDRRGPVRGPPGRAGRGRRQRPRDPAGAAGPPRLTAGAACPDASQPIASAAGAAPALRGVARASTPRRDWRDAPRQPAAGWLAPVPPDGTGATHPGSAPRT